MTPEEEKLFEDFMKDKVKREAKALKEKDMILFKKLSLPLKIMFIANTVASGAFILLVLGLLHLLTKLPLKMPA